MIKISLFDMIFGFEFPPNLDKTRQRAVTKEILQNELDTKAKAKAIYDKFQRRPYIYVSEKGEAKITGIQNES